MIEVGVGQAQQILEERDTQIVDQTEGNARQEIVAEVRTGALPEHDDHQQQGHAISEVEFAEQRNAVEGRSFLSGQPVDKKLQDAGLHRLGRGEDDEAQQTDDEQPDEGTQIAEQPEIDLQG